MSNVLLTKKINNYVVKPIKKIGGNKNSKPVKGGDLFKLYCNIFVCARKESGKTTVVYNIIDWTCTKNTVIIFFVPTFYADDGYYENITDLCERKGINFIVHTSLMDDEIKGLDVLQELVSYLQNKNEIHDEETAETKNPQIEMFEEIEEAKEEKPKKSRSKWEVPEYLFIFDYMSMQIRYSKSLVALIKESRHIKSKVLISSQNWIDVPKDARGNIDYLILFRGIPEEKLKDIYDENSISKISFEEFLKIYYTVTKIKKVKGKIIRHDFLYFDKPNEVFRYNFDHIIKTSYDLTEQL